MSSAPGLESGLRILESIAKAGGAAGIGFNQLKNELNLNPASLNRYLKVLLDNDFICKGENQLYIPGAKLMNISRSVLDPRRLDTAIATILDQISASSGFTSIWFHYWQGRMHCLNKHQVSEGIVMQKIGEVRTDYILHPWGFLWLADVSAVERKLIVENVDVGHFTKELLSKERLDSFIAHASSRGWSDDEAAVYQGIRRIAVGVRVEGRLVASIAVGMPGAKWDDKTIAGVVQLMQGKARQMETLLMAKMLNSK